MTVVVLRVAPAVTARAETVGTGMTIVHAAPVETTTMIGGEGIGRRHAARPSMTTHLLGAATRTLTAAITLLSRMSTAGRTIGPLPRAISRHGTVAILGKVVTRGMGMSVGVTGN